MNSRIVNLSQLKSTLSREQAQPLTSGCAVACAVVMVVLSAMPAGGQLIVAALIACGVLFRVSACVHISLLITLILRGLPDAAEVQTSFGITDVLFALATVGYVALAFRTLELDVRRIEDLTTREPDQSVSVLPTTAAPGLAKSQSPSSSLRPLSGLGIPVTLACTIAVAMLAVVSLRLFWPNAFRLLPEALRAIVIIWLLTAAAVLAGIWCATRAWQRLTYDQIGVLARRTLCDELKRELPHLELQRSRRLWRLYKNRNQS